MIKKSLEKLPPYLLTAICFIAICWLTLAPRPLGDTEIELFPHADKVVHAIMFGGFTLCVILDRARRGTWLPCSAKTAAVAVLAAILFGTVTELLQSTMHEGRSGDILDLAADSAGAIAAALACRLIRFPKKGN